MRSIAPVPFCDYINVTSPAESYPAILEQLLEVVRCAGGRDASEGLLYLGRYGTFKYGVRYKVGQYSLSGDAIAELRDGPFDYWSYWLASFSGEAHNVSRLDVSLDVDHDAAPELRRLYRLGRSGKFAFTRKHIPPHEVRRIIAPAVAGGPDTGTVDLGERGKRDVYGKIYDKRQHLLQRVLKEHGGAAREELIALNDPGPLTRYEISLGRKIGATLKDAYEPEAVFWHFAGDDFAPFQRRRPGVPEWRAHGTGFTVEAPVAPDYARQLRLLLETSHDVRRAVTLADRLGPYGRDHLCSLLQKLDGADLTLSMQNRQFKRKTAAVTENAHAPLHAPA